MRKRERIFTIFLTMVLMLAVLPFPVSANSPEPSPWYDFRLSNLPEGTVYVDLLIYLPDSDPMYTDLNWGNIPDQFLENAQILTYCDNDYRSYTFHYRDALSVMNVDRSLEVHFFTDKDYELVRYDHADEIYDRGEIRLAMLDHQGNILKVSPLLDLRPRDSFGYLTGIFHYDVKTDTFEVQTGGSGIGAILYCFLCLIGMVFTCIVEKLVAVPFHLNKRYGSLIVWTNVVSQILMHLFYILLYRFVFWKYTYATIILEMLVYLGEYLVYRWKMKEVSGKRRFAYAMAANTASLVMGLLIYRKLLY